MRNAYADLLREQGYFESSRNMFDEPLKLEGVSERRALKCAAVRRLPRPPLRRAIILAEEQQYTLPRAVAIRCIRREPPAGRNDHAAIGRTLRQPTTQRTGAGLCHPLPQHHARQHGRPKPAAASTLASLASVEARGNHLNDSAQHFEKSTGLMKKFSLARDSTMAVILKRCAVVPKALHRNGEAKMALRDAKAILR